MSPPDAVPVSAASSALPVSAAGAVSPAPSGLDGAPQPVTAATVITAAKISAITLFFLMNETLLAPWSCDHSRFLSSVRFYLQVV